VRVAPAGLTSAPPGRPTGRVPRRL